MQKSKKVTAYASPAHAVANSNHPGLEPEHESIPEGQCYFTRQKVLRQEKQILMKGNNKMLTNRQTAHRPFFEFFLFLLGRTEQPIDQVMIAWSASHPIGGDPA